MPNIYVFKFLILPLFLLLFFLLLFIAVWTGLSCKWEAESQWDYLFNKG